MAALTKRATVGILAISLVLATILGFGVFSVHSDTEAVQAQRSARVAVVEAFVNAIASGDVDGAMAAFADDAFYIGANPTGTCSTQAPCTDLAGIRPQMQSNVGGHVCQTIRSIQVSGSVVFGTFEVRADRIRRGGIERVLNPFMLQIPEDKITFYAGRLDLTDPQTALFAAILAGTAEPTSQPLPNPATPCG